MRVVALIRQVFSVMHVCGVYKPGWGETTGILELLDH